MISCSNPSSNNSDKRSSNCIEYILFVFISLLHIRHRSLRLAIRRVDQGLWMWGADAGRLVLREHYVKEAPALYLAPIASVFVCVSTWPRPQLHNNGPLSSFEEALPGGIPDTSVVPRLPAVSNHGRTAGCCSAGSRLPVCRIWARLQRAGQASGPGQSQPCKYQHLHDVSLCFNLKWITTRPGLYFYTSQTLKKSSQSSPMIFISVSTPHQTSYPLCNLLRCVLHLGRLCAFAIPWKKWVKTFFLIIFFCHKYFYCLPLYSKLSGKFHELQSELLHFKKVKKLI